MGNLSSFTINEFTFLNSYYNSYYKIDNDKQVAVSNPSLLPSNVQIARQIHENAIEKTSTFFKQKNLNVNTNVSIKSPDAAQSSVIDQVIH